jgi:DNA-binding response OmpR family regulator
LDTLTKLSVNKQLPDLIILDINMPGKDGLNTLKEIRLSSEYLNVPIVMYSNSDSDTLVNSCRNAGCTDYIVKPSLFQEVIDGVEKMLKYCA